VGGRLIHSTPHVLTHSAAALGQHYNATSLEGRIGYCPSSTLMSMRPELVIRDEPENAI
jgi:hypothetical protein